MKYTVKRTIFFLLVSCLCVSLVYGQRHRKFDPNKFEADLEQFIAQDACLSPYESSVFFPVYREMRKKQMAYFGEDRRYRLVDTSNDKACAQAIKRHDQIDIEIKKIQQSYHNKFLKILPASKVFRILRSEDKFHRQMFNRAARHDRMRKGR